MNKVLGRNLKKVLPKISKVFQGIKIDSQVGIQYLTENIHNTLSSGDTGLTLDGIFVASPEERITDELKLNTSGNSTINVELTDSSIYLVFLKFKYMGKQINPIPLYLPYTDENGLLTISDIKYQVNYVLTDTIMSVNKNASKGDSIFLRFLRTKTDVKKINKIYYLDEVRKTINIPHTMFYGGKNVSERMKIALPFYIYGKYGLYNTFKNYFGVTKLHIFDEKCGCPDDEIYLKYESEKNIFNSATAKNKNHGHVTICVGESGIAYNQHTLDVFVVSLIYFFDTCNNSLSEFKNIYFIPDGNYDEDVEYWRLSIGKMIFYGKHIAVSNILNDMDAHFKSIDNYVDNIVSNRLKAIGLDIDNIYDFLYYLTETFDEKLLNYKKINNDLSIKYLDTTYYIFFDIIAKVNRAIYTIGQFHKTSGSNNTVNINVMKIYNVFVKTLKKSTIKELIAGNGINLAVTAVDYPGTLKLSKMTTSSMLQEQGNGVNKNSMFKVGGTLKNYTAYWSMFGDIYKTIKTSPTPFSKINIFQSIDEVTGELIYSDKEIELLKVLSKPNTEN